MSFYIIFALLFAVVVAVFAVNNNAVVTLQFLLWSFRASLVLVILGSAALGAGIIGILGFFKQLSLNMKLWDLQGKKRKLETQLEKAQEAETVARGQLERVQQELVRWQEAAGGGLPSGGEPSRGQEG